MFYKKNDIKFRNAFSLVELSIVILIIGILISGTILGLDLFNQYKLVVARNLTSSSIVSRIPGLQLWLETTNEKSFSPTVKNNSTISLWNDLNPTTSKKINPYQNTPSLMPKYIESSPIAGLPSIRFDGGQYLEFIPNSPASTPLAEGDDTFTFFAVFTSGSTNQVIFEQNNNGALTQGKRACMLTSNDRMGFNGESNDFHNAVSFTRNKIFILSIRANNGAIDVFSNSLANSPSASGTIDANIANVSDGGFFIGVKGITSRVEKYNGYISEIIVYDEALTNPQIANISLYLSKKYNIKLS
jgi:prepilin-type N-terminal cleavage/methylation domain-containing protein